MNSVAPVWPVEQKVAELEGALSRA
eukprot:SAG22_NODE_16261_length_329_cov_1.113043_2_plen_24_part_01